MSKPHRNTIPSDNRTIRINTEAVSMQRNFQGIWMPASLWCIEGVSWQERILLLEIQSLDQGNGCFASDEYLAKFLRISRGRLKNVLTKLRKRGWLRTIAFDGRRRHLQLSAKLQHILSAPIQELIAEQASTITCDQGSQKRDTCCPTCGTTLTDKTVVKPVVQKGCAKPVVPRKIVEGTRKNEAAGMAKANRRNTPKRPPIGVVQPDTTPLEETPAYKVAIKLKNVLVRHRWIHWTPKLAKWAKALRKLHKADLNPVHYSEMRAAIAWLDANADSPYCPKPKDAGQFAIKFGQIWIQMHTPDPNITGHNVQTKPVEKKNPLPWWEDRYTKLKKGTPCRACSTTDKRVYETKDPRNPARYIKLCAECHWERYDKYCNQ